MCSVRIAFNFSGGKERTTAVVFLIISVEWEHVVADSGCVEIVPDPEVSTKCSLKRRLPVGNEQAKRSREVVDNILERDQVRDWGEEARTWRPTHDKRHRHRRYRAP